MGRPTCPGGCGRAGSGLRPCVCDAVAGACGAGAVGGGEGDQAAHKRVMRVQGSWRKQADRAAGCCASPSLPCTPLLRTWRSNCCSPAQRPGCSGAATCHGAPAAAPASAPVGSSPAASRPRRGGGVRPGRVAGRWRGCLDADDASSGGQGLWRRLLLLGHGWPGRRSSAGRARINGTACVASCMRLVQAASITSHGRVSCAYFHQGLGRACMQIGAIFHGFVLKWSVLCTATCARPLTALGMCTTAFNL